jgi:hypothetical protein
VRGRRTRCSSDTASRSGVYSQLNGSLCSLLPHPSLVMMWSTVLYDNVRCDYISHRHSTATATATRLAALAMASFSLQRVLRFMRSVQYMIAVFGFSCLLTFIFILYQPTAGPGIIQHLGWQSWETISSATQARPPRPTQTPSSGSSTTPDVDWWNVTEPQHGDVDSASFPLDVWAPLLPHDTGRMYLKCAFGSCFLICCHLFSL